MRRLLWIGVGLAALGAFARDDDDEETTNSLIATPFLLGLAIEVAIFALRNSQSRLLFPPSPR